MHTSSSFCRLVAGDDADGANSTGLIADCGPASNEAKPNDTGPLDLKFKANGITF